MTALEIVQVLKNLPQDELFMYGLSFYAPENIIDMDWKGERQTVFEVLVEMQKFHQNEIVTIDVDDGFIYHEITSVELRYWSATENYYDFIG